MENLEHCQEHCQEIKALSEQEQANVLEDKKNQFGGLKSCYNSSNS